MVAGTSSRPAPLVQVPREPEDVRLEHVLEEREPADHVPVERRVPDRELGLVPGRDHEPAVRVRERHQEHAAHPGLEVLRGEALGAAAVGSRSTSWNAPTTASIGISRNAAPRLSASCAASPRVSSDEYRDGIETRCTRSAPSASTQSAAVTAESMPAGDGRRRPPEPVLLDVVAQAERERSPHLLELGLERRDGGARRGSPLGWRRAELDDLDRGHGLARAVELTPPHVAKPAPHRDLRLDVRDEQVLLEAGRTSDDLARVVEDDRVAVEDELVLPADEVAEGEERGRVPRARDEHLLAILGLPDVEGRGGEVDDELRSRQRQVGRRRPRLPDVLADRRPDEDVSDPDEDELAPLEEVAVLVEDAVVRQEVLAVDGLHTAVGADRARVREVAVEPGRPDERDDARRGARDLLQRLAGRVDEAGAEQEILGRIAGDRELREDDEIAPAARASSTDATIRSRFPARSPTTAFSCASAILKVFASQS